MCFGPFKKKGIDYYERELQSLSPKKREKAASDLWKVKDPRAVELLASALRDTESEVRLAAAETLSRVGNPAAVRPLARTLDDHDESVRLTAAESLMALGDRSGMGTLAADVEPQLRLLNDPNEAEPNDAVAVVILGETAYGMEVLSHVLKEHPDKELRQLAALVLSCATEPLVVEALTLAQREDTAEEVRKVAADALEWIPTAERDEAFCLKCRTKQKIKYPALVTFKNTRLGTTGTCPSCGTSVFRF